jgi:hypothetical protein
MNKLYRLPLRTRTKNLSSGVRRRKNSSKILAAVILSFCALAALVAIGFTAFLTYKHMKGKPTAVSTASPTPVAKAKDVLLPLADPNKAPSEGTASANSAVSPQPSPPVLMSSPVATPVTTPAPTPAVPAAQHPQKTDSQLNETEKPLSKAARKTLEKKRLEAERKRAQLEKSFQNHEISTEAYNNGKEAYKKEIQKYRDALKAGA